MKANLLVLRTSGFSEYVPQELQALIVAAGMRKVSPETNFLVFDPEAQQECKEDGGASLRIPMKDLKSKVYAILDDYGSSEALSESCGYPVQTRYALTFLLPEEY